MKKKVLLVISFILVLGIGILLGTKFSKSNLYEEENYVPEATHKNMLSMMLEQNAGEGDYSLETRSSWPTKEDGYVFNSTLSKCEKGSKLRWDDENNTVVMVGTTSDKCYVYFDVYNPPTLIADVCSSGDNLAGCVKKLYQESNSDLTNIYYHDSTLTNGAGDNSYRYAGSSDTTNNFVCFGSDATTCPDDNLYRVIGVFEDKVKLIKWDYAKTALLGTNGDYSEIYSKNAAEDDGYSDSNYIGEESNLSSIGGYYWNGNDTNTWSTSNLNMTNLNVNYINNIGSTWANKIAETTWIVGGNTYSSIQYKTASVAYINEYINPAENTIETAKIGLMYTSDYGFAASPSAWTSTLSSYSSSSITSINWMYMGLYEWTITRVSDYSYLALFLSKYGYVDANYKYDSVFRKFAVRPVFYLNSDVEYSSGTGTKNDPIRIKID